MTDTLVIGGDVESQNFFYLHSATRVLPDLSGELSIHQVTTAEHQSQFFPYHAEVMRETPGVSKYWHQATIQNLHQKPIDLWYYSGSTHTLLYDVDTVGRVTIHAGGRNLPYNKQSKYYPQSLYPPIKLVPIHLEALEVKTYYWYSTFPDFWKRYSRSLAGNIVNDEFLTSRQARVTLENYSFSFVLGLIVAITTFLFIFYSIYREPAFFALAFLGLTALIWYLYNKGLLFTTVLASSSSKSGGYELGEYILVSLRIWAFYFYVVVFLRLKEVAPGWYKTFKWTTGILTGIVVTDFLLRFFLLPHHFQIHILGWQMVNGGIALMLLPYLGVGIHLTLRKVPLAGVYLVGNLFNVTGLVLHTLSMNFISGPFLGTIDQWGTALMLVTFSMALAIRMRSIEKEKLRAETEVIQIDADLKAAGELDAMKTSFFTSISHEFRTPLTLILAPLEKMHSETADKQEKGRFELILRNARRMQTLINQLLELAKLQSNKVTLQVSEHDFSMHLRTITSAHMSLAESNNIQFHINLPSDGLALFYDREMMNKIVNNLLSNAFKYCTKNGSVALDSILENDAAVLKIENSSDPIPPEDQERIFNHFQRLETQHHRTEGTGVGLALVKDYVGMHHGEIRVTNTPEQRVCFTVRFPLGKDHFKAEELVAGSIDQIEDLDSFASGEDELPEALPAPSKKDAPVILIIEDNPDMQKFIQEELEEIYAVLTAVNGVEGLKLSKAEIPDLIISDVMMPEMDGFTFLAEARKDPLLCHIPIIMLTALSTDDSKFKGLETGADDYLLKPFNTRELRIRVANLIRQRELLRERFILDQAQDLKEVTVSSMDEKFLRSIMASIEENMADMAFGVNQLAKHVHMSRSQLFRKLTALTNLSPTDFIRVQRLKRAADLLSKKAATVTEIAYMVGFQNPAHFATRFKKEFGISPSKYHPES